MNRMLIVAAMLIVPIAGCCCAGGNYCAPSYGCCQAAPCQPAMSSGPVLGGQVVNPTPEVVMPGPG
jgi:hypothetical protein